MVFARPLAVTLMALLAAAVTTMFVGPRMVPPADRIAAWATSVSSRSWYSAWMPSRFPRHMTVCSDRESVIDRLRAD